MTSTAVDMPSGKRTVTKIPGSEKRTFEIPSSEAEATKEGTVPLAQHAALRGKGRSDERIAAAFFVAEQVVVHPLKHAGVARSLRQGCAEDGMALDHLTAITASQDHERRSHAREAIRNKESHQVRRKVTEKSVRAFARYPVFAGIVADKAAGRPMLRDQCQDDDGVSFEVAALRDRRVSENVQVKANAPAAEEWSSHSTCPMPTATVFGGRADTRRQSRMKKASAVQSFSSRFRQLMKTPQLGMSSRKDRRAPWRVGRRNGDARPRFFGAKELVRSGVFVTLDRYGELDVFPGFVRLGDEHREDEDVHSGEQAEAGRASSVQ